MGTIGRKWTIEGMVRRPALRAGGGTTSRMRWKLAGRHSRTGSCFNHVEVQDSDAHQKRPCCTPIFVGGNADRAPSKLSAFKIKTETRSTFSHCRTTRARFSKGHCFGGPLVLSRRDEVTDCWRRIRIAAGTRGALRSRLWAQCAGIPAASKFDRLALANSAARRSCSNTTRAH